MRRAIPTAAIALLAVGTFSLARVDQQPGQALANDRVRNIGTLKLYTSTRTESELIQKDLAAKVVLDGEYVGDYKDFTHNTPAHFRLSAGKHKVRVELEGSKPFEAEIHLIGNDTSQYLRVSLDRQ